MTAPLEWRAAAACHDPARNVLPYRRSRQAQMKRLCHACPVLDICLWTTMENERTESFRFGIAGGTTPADRDWIAEQVPAPLWHQGAVRAGADWRAAGSPTEPTRILACQRCGKTIRQPLAGKRRRWCSDRCKDAWTTRRAVKRDERRATTRRSA